MFTLDNVDWNQIPPDNNTGIQFPIQLHTAGPLALSNAHVVQHDAANLSSSALTVKADVTNDAATRRRTVSATSPPRAAARSASAGGHGPRRRDRDGHVHPERHPHLLIDHPRVWWPYQMGGQPLYWAAGPWRSRAALPTREPRRSASARHDPAGRPRADRAPRPRLPGQRRAVRVPRGGWSENLFLHYSAPTPPTRSR